ncbi:MAG: 1-acyl-sn-glycerol-3-phosphate acyltransferase [Alphaproteobacteria bacterium]|nr:1-acyl-sn-glycerol-3-phosphate acyltransferase [Alphaproteobacteria bacterium]
MIRVIRSFLCLLCFVIFGVGALGLGGIIFPIMLFIYRNPAKRRQILSKSIHISWKFFVWLMAGMRLISVRCGNMLQLKTVRGHIIIANHPSLIDVVILISLIPNSVCVVKKSLFHNLFIKKVIQHIYLSNDMSADEFIVRGTEFLDNGYNILIFPEGTRTVKGRKTRLHRGFAYLHIKTGKPVLPICIENVPQILGKMQKWYDIGTRTSVYTLKLKPEISYNMPENQSLRDAAISVTNLAAGAIFEP